MKDHVKYGFAVFVAVMLGMSLPYACNEAQSFGCFDSETWTFENRATETVLVSPYTRSSDGVDSLVVHGLERSRFAVRPGEARSLDVETGDYPFGGVAVEFEDGVVRELPVDLTRDVYPLRIEIGPSRSYPLAASDVSARFGRARSAIARVPKFAIMVLCPAFIVGFVVARRRAAHELIAASR